MCSIIWLSVNPPSNFPELHLLQADRLRHSGIHQNRCSQSHMTLPSCSVPLGWQNYGAWGKCHSLEALQPKWIGLNQHQEATNNARDMVAMFMLLPKRVSVLDPLFRRAGEETEDMHLEEEYNNMGGEECSTDSFFWCCFASETRRFKMARFASLRSTFHNCCYKRERNRGKCFVLELEVSEF